MPHYRQTLLRHHLYLASREYDAPALCLDVDVVETVVDCHNSLCGMRACVRVFVMQRLLHLCAHRGDTSTHYLHILKAANRNAEVADRFSQKE